MDTDANGTVLEVDEVTPCMRDASQPSDAGDELRRLAASLQSDDESRAIVKGMAASADRLRSMGTVHPLHPVVEYFLEFGRHLVEGQESIAANSAVLELSAPQHRDELQKLTVTVRHCVNGLVNNADTAKRCYAELDKAAAKALDDPKADVPALFRRIRQVTRQADLVIGQSIGQSEATLAAIRVFQNNNRVYQVGYRAVLHGILLFVAVGVVAAKIAAKELQSYEFVVITVGFVMYVVLEHSWWAYTTHKIAMAQRSIKKQANAMKALQKKIQELASKKQ